MVVSERQAAMLKEMGIRLWRPPVPDAASTSPLQADAVEAAPAAAAPVPRAGTEALRPMTPPAASDAAPARPGREAPAPDAEPVAAVSRPVRLREPVAPVGDPVGGVAGMGWEALEDAVANCTACALCEGRTRTVFGVGHASAHWMVVGEAPGEQEDRQGEPFVGKSGQLLDNMLAALGLTRQPAEAARQVYIANTVKCRPPGNRNPDPTELARCEPYLVRQIALVKPRVILAMGRFAVQSLLRSNEPIGRLRGRVHQFEGVPLVVTYHPAYLLRNPEDKGRAWDDLCLAREVLAQG
ncbi:uracil-DNA glycosylase [Rhizobacter sp. LjRoot28]|jgi:DNA polymerase|uniref:uracil-DNA glycosylase n=1 Tax=Rhizobacter sp. LjRoot28 TaxID=3342309 RepID=UPI003ECC3A92